MKIISGLKAKKIPIPGRNLRQKKLGYHRV
jgi:hypothetical protein